LYVVRIGVSRRDDRKVDGVLERRGYAIDNAGATCGSLELLVSANAPRDSERTHGDDGNARIAQQLAEGGNRGHVFRNRIGNLLDVDRAEPWTHGEKLCPEMTPARANALTALQNDRARIDEVSDLVSVEVGDRQH